MTSTSTITSTRTITRNGKQKDPPLLLLLLPPPRDTTDPKAGDGPAAPKAEGEIDATTGAAFARTAPRKEAETENMS